MSKYPGLKRRGSRGIYQLRLAVPRDLHAVFGRKEVTVSLRTSDSQKAVDRFQRGWAASCCFRRLSQDSCRGFSLKPIAEGF
ncbi:DUF6538 domain-containing protein [Desulfovibrio caledoniensis]